MEQKQSLWIIAAVGVFLLVVIGAAVILYSPTTAKADSRTAVTAPVQSLPVQGGLQETAPVLQLQDLNTLMQPQTPAAVTPVQGVTPDQTATITAPDGSVISIPAQSPQYLALLQTLNVTPQATAVQAPQYQNVPQPPAPQYQSAPQAPQSPVQTVNDLTVISSGTTHVIGTGATTFSGNTAPAASPAAAPTEINIQTVVPLFSDNKTTTTASASAKTATAVASAPAATTAPAKAAAPAKTPEPPKVTQYWVQAASFETKKNADAARGTLEENRIPGEIFTYSGSDGKLLYRVRVGPYETKSEAERAQAELRRIKNFENNQTFVVNSTKQ
jgi:cell division protein FtsN